MGFDTAQPTRQCVYIVVYLFLQVQLTKHAWHRSSDVISLAIICSQSVKGPFQMIMQDLKKIHLVVALYIMDNGGCKAESLAVKSCCFFFYTKGETEIPNLPPSSQSVVQSCKEAQIQR